MLNLGDNVHQALKEIKSIEHIMINAYRIAESSEFYTPINKENWK